MGEGVKASDQTPHPRPQTSGTSTPRLHSFSRLRPAPSSHFLTPSPTPGLITFREKWSKMLQPWVLRIAMA